MDLQEDRLDRIGTKAAGKNTFLYGKGNINHELGTGLSFFFLLCSLFYNFFHAT
jgi:hypothetical protein